MGKRKWIIGLATVGALLCLCGFLMDVFGPDEEPAPAPKTTPTPKATPTPLPPTSTPRPQPSPSPTPKGVTSIDEWKGVHIGMTADDVLKVWGQGEGTRQVGSDSQGLIVEWIYDDAILTMKMRTESGITCYRVAEIRLR